MSRPPRHLLIALSAGLAATLVGCESGPGSDMETRNATLSQRLDEVTEENERLRADFAAVQRGASTAESTMNDLRQENARLRSELANNRSLMERLDQRLRGIAVAPIDQATDKALRDLAAANPDLIKYDPDRAMLRFSSDLTFDSGSAQVRDTASSTLGSLGDVLNGAASEYELTIVGHTDSAPISAATARRHPSNTHLSVHRAISVKQRLASLGVANGRMLVAGWGPERPVVENTERGNTPENRRVEIFLELPEGFASEEEADPTK